MSLRKVYEACRDGGPEGDLARMLLAQQDWFSAVAEFDPRTSDALPLGLDEVLRRLASLANAPFVRDRLWRIVEHCRLSVERIFGALSENPRREQAMLPIRDVRELDATSFIALSRRPGRNIREKLAGKPHMQAVRRYQSTDLPQNRLLKEFVSQLADLLELRAACLAHEDDLLSEIYRWLRSDEAEAIGPWENLPPNNTLLSHRDYRRVWDAWIALQALDDAIDADLKHFNSRATTIERWNAYCKGYARGTAVFGSVPVLFDYDKFAITPLRALAIDAADPPLRRQKPTPTISTPVCIDLTPLRPRYSVDGASAHTMSEAFLWQRWHNDVTGLTEDLGLYEADAAVTDPRATSVTWANLIFTSDDSDADLLNSAASSFTRRLAGTFTHPALVALVPDHLNDFDLQLTRRHINARFPQAEPLPRSVAAVIEHVAYATISLDGFRVVVVDTVGGVTSATPLTARYDKDLADRLPATRGYYWERAPHAIIDSAAPVEPFNEILHVDENGYWHDPVPSVLPPSVDRMVLQQHPSLGQFDAVVNVPTSPVIGGIHLYLLQQHAANIPLWRDQIPELSIKVIQDGRYEPFFLVNRGTTIRPVRGKPVQIPVTRSFTLPAGKDYFQFPLFQGNDANDLGYVARLESPDFPLARDAIYDLVMTYTYGADDPYRLVFQPRDTLLRPVTATWQRKTDEEITDAPGPEYPRPLTWHELRRYWNPVKGKMTDLPDWAATATRRLLRTLDSDVVAGTIKIPWRTDKNGNLFTFVEVAGSDDVFLHESVLLAPDAPDDLAPGDIVFLARTSANGKVRANHASRWANTVASALPGADEIPEFIRRALYVPYIKTWSDGRSLMDVDCPSDFRREMGDLIPSLEEKLRSGTTEAIEREIAFLFSCMHKDIPAEVSTNLANAVLSGRFDEKAVGFALGDLSVAWQQQLFAELLRQDDNRSLRVFSRAIWRTESFARAFDAETTQSVCLRALNALTDAAERANRSPREVSHMVRYCELTLGLLRSRDSDNATIQMVLQPNQVLTRRLAEQVERLSQLIVKESISFESRVQINLPGKPADDPTPDLLYALRLYLTGDIGSHAIRVTGITDTEDN